MATDGDAEKTEADASGSGAPQAAEKGDRKPARPTLGLLQRQIEGLKRQKGTGATSAAVAASASTAGGSGPSKAAADDKVASQPAASAPAADATPTRRVVRSARLGGGAALTDGLVKAAFKATALAARAGGAKGIEAKLRAAGTGAAAAAGAVPQRVIRHAVTTTASEELTSSPKLSANRRLAVQRLLGGAPLKKRLRMTPPAESTRSDAAADGARAAARGVHLVRQGGVTLVKAEADESEEEEEEDEVETRPVPLRRGGALLSKAAATSLRRGERGDTDGERHQNGRPQLKKPAVARPKHGDTRGRNLLGNLMGHLASAKKGQAGAATQRPKLLLAAGKAKVRGRTAAKLASAAAVRQEADREEEPEEEEEAKNEEAEEAEAEDATMTEKERKAQARTQYKQEMHELRDRLEEHYLLMKNFIRTRAEPTIFYLPVRKSKKTDELKEETCGAIDQKIAALEEQLEVLPEELEGSDEAAKDSDAE
eukprot:TRINITY_DN13041_c0_g1_i1.p1 TRINITY_DN13041_c0_g1~~TRINITY_DN13041_c0_g1_i1.p1  ORF type:complete len:484 (-),score=170.74 TRINITY_DN13041_c0_g1_i1:258-1709(-)